MSTYRKFDNLVVVCYSDANFVGYVDDKKSTSGYISTIVGGAISTVEAEYVAMFCCYWVGCMAKELYYGIKSVDNILEPLLLYYDN